MNFMQQFNTVANAESGATLHFELPTGGFAYLDYDADEPKQAVTVTMLGANSDAHKKHSLETIRITREKNKKSKKDVDIPDNFFEETAASQVRRLCAVVTDWANIVDEDGKSLKCTKENVKLVFSKYQELRVQAINFLDKDANFIKS